MERRVLRSMKLEGGREEGRERAWEREKGEWG